MSAPAEPEIVPVKLHCLSGHGPPREIVSDFLGFLGLPEGARADIWQVLALFLGEDMPRVSEGAIDRFCAAHQADGAILSRFLKAARFLVRQAAAHDLSTAVFAEDLMAITDGDEATTKRIAGGYDAVRDALRAELVRLSFADHGKLLERVDWRSDYLTSSSRGERLRTPYVVMTFTYREGEQRGRVSLQMPRDAVAQLRAMCDKILA